MRTRAKPVRKSSLPVLPAFTRRQWWLAAILLALVPPLVVPGTAFAEWLQRALTFLVISCPCALVISVPLTFFAGIGGASRNGILIKGSNYLETLANCKTTVFDKTGTLTRGVFAVSRILPAAGIGEDRLLKTAAAAESASNHPIALSIRKAAGEKETGLPGGQAEEIAGCGVRIKKDGKEILAGNLKLMEKFKISGIKEADGGTVAYIAEDGKYLGALVISDTVKETAAGAVAELGKLGIRTVMLTGDQSKLDALINLLEDYEILELARTGLTGLSRGSDDVRYLP